MFCVMSSLVAYAASSDEEEEEEGERSVVEAPTQVLARSVETAPMVVGVAKEGRGGRDSQLKAWQNNMVLERNLPAATLLAAKQGPEHPYRRNVENLETGSVFVGGAAQRANVEDWSFHEQFHTYQSYGYAADAAGGNNLVGTQEGLDRAANNGAETISTRIKKKKKKRKDNGEYEDLGDEEVHGIWGPEDEDEKEEEPPEKQREAPAEKKKRGYDQNEDFDRRDERKKAHLLPPRHSRDTTPGEASSTFHDDRETDYQGRSWIEAPTGLRHRVDDGHDCFLPKKCTHQWRGHTKGVQAIKLFPKTGHLLLSASFDGTCKIWDVCGNKTLKRTYEGHTEAVRDATFDSLGTSFASTGFDRFVRVWDSETGACKHVMSPNRKMCFCVDFYPKDDHILLAGASDNKIYQWDLRTPSPDGTPQIVQEYNHHLQAVNSVTFVDDDRRFVSTADDKKIFIWEYGIPVPIKYISEPHMQSVPVVEMHPSGNFWCGQSLDNSIVTYQAKEKMKQLRKKTFRGHSNIGYSLGLTFSPNGKFLASGDGNGRIVIWDFKSLRLLRKIHAHDNGPCSDLLWHPIEPSTLITAGWDNTIKLWE